MGLRDTIRNTPIAGVVIAAILIGLAVLVVMRSNQPPPDPQAYYLDLSTGDLFVHTKRATPPIDVPGGAAGMGVRAAVIGCGDCSASNRKVAYIEKFSREAIAAMSATPVDDEAAQRNQMTIMQGRLVAHPPQGGAEPQWVSGETEAGITIVGAASTICGGGGGDWCKPE